MNNDIFRFLVISLVFGVLAWGAKKYIPEATIGLLVAIAIIIVWLWKYFLPFLGISL